MHVKDHVAVIGHHALTVFRTAAQLDQLARHGAARHRNDLNRQREFTQNIDLLGGIGDADKFIRYRGDDLLTGQRRAAAFDHLHVAVDLIRAVNVDPQAIDAVEIEDGDPEAFQLLGGGIGAGNRPFDLPLHGAQRVNKMGRRRAGAYADNSPWLYILQCCPTYRFFQFILRHNSGPRCECLWRIIEHR